MISQAKKNRLIKTYGILSGIGITGTLLATLPKAMFDSTAVSFLGLTGIKASIAMTGAVGLTLGLVIPATFFLLKKIIKKIKERRLIRKSKQLARKQLLMKSGIIKDAVINKDMTNYGEYINRQKLNKKVFKKSKRWSFAEINCSVFGGPSDKKVICMVSKKPNKQGLYNCFSPYVTGSSKISVIAPDKLLNPNLARLNIPAEEINNVLLNNNVITEVINNTSPTETVSTQNLNKIPVGNFSNIKQPQTTSISTKTEQVNDKNVVLPPKPESSTTDIVVVAPPPADTKDQKLEQQTANNLDLNKAKLSTPSAIEAKKILEQLTNPEIRKAVQELLNATSQKEQKQK